MNEPEVQPPPRPPKVKRELQRIRKVVLTDEVSRNLFAEYAEHQASDRGAEEIGWALLGLREADHVIVLATLPAGRRRDAGEAHVMLNGEAQALATRVCWQSDRRLRMLGVVHTHPGRLRHPSAGDFDGDRVWVRNLRGNEGVFGIGTVERGTHPDAAGVAVGDHPRPNVQSFGELRFDWYSLAADDKKYQPLPVELTLGPDLASDLRGVWGPIEEYATRLDRLARQLSKARFEVAVGTEGPALSLRVDLANSDEAVRVLMEGKTVRFFYEAGPDVFQPDLPLNTAPDQGIYLLLAELAARA